jgi:hypothetical protein
MTRRDGVDTGWAGLGAQRLTEKERRAALPIGAGIRWIDRRGSSRRSNRFEIP